MRALIFDLDGTLVDTVYAHALAWQRVLDEAGFPLEGWKIHRLIGMSGGLLTHARHRPVERWSLGTRAFTRGRPARVQQSRRTPVINLPARPAVGLIWIPA